MNVKWTKLSDVLLDSTFSTNTTEDIMSLAECTIVTISQGYEHCRSILERVVKSKGEIKASANHIEKLIDVFPEIFNDIPFNILPPDEKLYQSTEVNIIVI